jgi:hypothetical protein
VLGAGRYAVAGELMIRGVTQPVRLVVDLFGRAPDVVGNPGRGFRATARLQRARSGITLNAPVLGGGVALADEVDLELDAQDRLTVLCPAVDLRRSRAASGDPQGVPRSVLAALALRSRER